MTADNSSPGVVKNTKEYFDLLSILHYTLSLPPFKSCEDEFENIKEKIQNINPVFSFDEDERAIDFISKDFSLFKDKNRYRNFSIIERILKIAQEKEIFPHMDYVYILYVNQKEKKYIDNETPPNSVKNLLFPSHRSQLPALDILNALRNYQANTLKIFDNKFLEDDVKKIRTILKNGKNENGDQLISGIITSDASYMKDGKELKGEGLFDFMWEKYIEKSAPIKDQPIEEILLLDVLSREILAVYLLEKRKELKGFQDILLKDEKKEFSFIREISIDYEERTGYEKCNSILLAQEGELFLSIYLYRMAIVHWKSELTNEAGRFPENTGDVHFQTLKNFLNNNSSDANQSIMTELLKRIGLIKDKSHLTSAASSMFRWFNKVCSDSDNFGYLKESLFKDKDKGLKLNESQLKELAEISKKLSNDGKNKGSHGLLSDLSKFFSTLLSEYHNSKKNGNQIIPLDFVELSRVFHVDPFVVNISMAHHEFQLNENKTKNTRHLFTFPIDPIILSTNNHHEMDDLSYEGIYALWIGYLEKPLQISSQSEKDKNTDIVCIKTILNLIGQPIVRQIVEKERIQHKVISKELEEMMENQNHVMRNDFLALSGLQSSILHFFNINQSKCELLIRAVSIYFSSLFAKKTELLARIGRENKLLIKENKQGNGNSLNNIICNSFYKAIMAFFFREEIYARINDLERYTNIENSVTLKENLKQKLNTEIHYKIYACADFTEKMFKNSKKLNYIELAKIWNEFYGDFLFKWNFKTNKDVYVTLNNILFDDDGDILLSVILIETFINMFSYGHYGHRYYNDKVKKIPDYYVKINLKKDNNIEILTLNPKEMDKNGIKKREFKISRGFRINEKIVKAIDKSNTEYHLEFFPNIRPENGKFHINRINIKRRRLTDGVLSR